MKSTAVSIYTVHSIYIQGGPKKSKPPPIFQKIELKIANEIRFLRKVKV